MKKTYYLFLVFLLFSMIISCNKPNNQNELTDEEKRIQELLYDEPGADLYRVYFNYMDGSDYTTNYQEVGFCQVIQVPKTPERQGYQFEGWFLDKECTEYFILNTEIIESIMLYAKWSKYSGPDMQFVIDEYIPDTTTDNIIFPSSIQDYPDVKLTWTTNDKHTISYEGIVNPDRIDTTVTVKLEVISGTQKNYYEKDVLVKALEFNQLPEKGIATGYYAHYNFNGYTEDQLKLDMIIIAFGYLNSNCEINMKSIEGCAAKMLEARKSGVRVLLSVQGIEATAHYFTEANKNDKTRQKLANNILSIIKEYHFDGVDIDWEYPGWNNPIKYAEANDYTSMMKIIYETVKAENEDYVVSAALPGGSEGYQRYNLSDVAPYLDYLNLMTYDLNANGYCFHHTALVANSQIGTMTEGGVDRSLYLYSTFKGFPSNKICIGIAFYGKKSTLSNNQGVKNNDGVVQRTSNNADATTITYTNIKKNYLTKVGNGDVFEYWDSVCHASWLYVKSENVFITYDSPKSVLEKCRYAMGYTVSENLKCPYELAGVMIWDVGEDATGDLMNAVVQGMHK